MTVIPEAYKRAIREYEIGHLAEAEVLCSQVVASNPEFVDGVHLYSAIASKKGEHGVARKWIERAISSDPRQPVLYNTLGLICADAGAIDKAVEAFKMAVLLHPKYAQAYYNLAITMKNQGQMAEAIINYQTVIQLEPWNTDARFNLANLLTAIGKIEAAIVLYRTVVGLKPDNAIAHNALGNSLILKGDLDAAITHYRQAVALKPDFPEPYNSLGDIFQKRENHREAIACYETYLALRPDMPDGHNNLGTMYHARGKFDRAACSFEKAMALKPDFAEAYYNYGNLLCDTNKIEKAIAYYLKALKIQPELAEAYNALGIVYRNLNLDREAIASFENAIRIKPDCNSAHNNLGNALFDLGRLDQAARFYQKALEIRPDSAHAHNGSANVFMRAGKLEKAILFYRQALKMNPDLFEAVGNLFESLLMTCSWGQLEEAAKQLDAANLKALAAGKRTIESPLTSITRHADPDVNYRVAKSWSKSISKKMSAYNISFPFENNRKLKQKITIGYLSGNFTNHPVAYQLAGLYQRHNREKFNVFCYSCGPDDGSDYRKRIMQDCDKFVDLRGVNHPDAARCVYADNVDILVDLMGHTRGNRLEIFALRPAPIQVGYLGFLGTTGADFMDYVITDRVVTPQEHAGFYSEKFVYMPHCYQINDNSQKISDKVWQKTDFGLPKDSFVFCSFNNPRKIESELFACWMKILRQVPDSVLWLQKGPRVTMNNLRQAAGQGRVNAKRLVFSGTVPLDKHLARLRLADLALDTGIYNGGATTSNALWAGVPVITKAGQHFVSRMTASSLDAIRLPDLIVKNLEEYTNLAIRLANNRDELSNYKKLLAKNRLTAPFFDTTRFVRNLESGYSRMWRMFVAGRRAEQIELKECLLPGEGY